MTRITLTFDNGPHLDGTPIVLDTLARHSIRTTFFVIAERLRDRRLRALAERAFAQGHWIGNHSLTHNTPIGLDTDPRAPWREIDEAQELIGALAGGTPYFRPFGGGRLGSHLLSPAAVERLVSGGHTCVLWNAVPGDWEDPQGWVDRALHQAGLEDWTVMVLHDSEPEAMHRLDEFLTRAKAACLSFRQDFPPECFALIDGQPGPAYERIAHS